jgi:hydrogenase-4 component F
VTSVLVWIVPLIPIGGALLTLCARSTTGVDRLNLVGAVMTGIAGASLSVEAMVHSSVPAHGSWYVVDGASGVFLAVITLVGFLSALVSPVYLARARHGFFPARRSHASYYIAFQLFWAALLALPLVANLAVGWLLVEVTTGASALLVAFSARRTALEAGWKYLVLTSCGLTIALLGILILYTGLTPHGGGLHTLDWPAIASRAPRLPASRALLALALITGGLASKIGWAPVHNWLPDAHSEAPPPVSALLSAALLPTVMLLAWRTAQTLAPALHHNAGRGLFIAFGLSSLAVAIPFLWRPLPYKRLLAYSSLEHMGVLALGIGFGTPLALAGVVLHLAGHALAKALGFYTAIALQRYEPEAAHQPARGLVSVSPAAAAAVGVSLGALSGLPPSPLFFSELLILLGGISGGYVVVSVIAAGLLALGFLGLTHALIEALLDDSAPHRRRWVRGQAIRATERLASITGVGLLALSASAFLLPHWNVIHTLMNGVK